MTSVLIDSFDTEEQAVAFVDWFNKQCRAGKVKLITTQGLKFVEYDGVDTYQTNKENITINIIVDDFESLDSE
jgi:hypothetical protein